MPYLILSLLTIASLSHCQKSTGSISDTVAVPYTQDQFHDYWYTGKAEVATYNLKQSRYGEIHDGKAVLIFVTEPFSRSKQVKLDQPEQAGVDHVTVMKLNYTKKFTTGIYPYSMMLSSFTPIDSYHHPKTLKLTMSSQEWCGHVFSQMNLDGKHYNTRSYSYFEQEGDLETKVDAALLEDELWNRIRLNYKSLPTGNIQVVPGLFFTRMAHDNLKPLDTTAELIQESDTATYTLTFPNRKLSISFSAAFPYHILSWKESYNGLGGKLLTTEAVFDKKLHIDYWSRNKTTDSYLRDSLNLE
ncbi:hypothetical protein C900_03193 [Fulvivirga imtechensis AK7]|uniref:Septum formation inhibitor Maf n=1 Tax=Fulvivirga imtechensis AK7 TaxID=1237149 RepID=L8JS70_9BACT|nr:hypothetical protein [Fulvivirga imtechensis]ELR71063.1 hypothetical protein C900_03193 [Fulvivirga imtechensis AK7]